MDDRRLLQESNLNVQQPCRAPIMLHIWFNKRCLLANEGLVNRTGTIYFTQMSHPPLLYGQ